MNVWQITLGSHHKATTSTDSSSHDPCPPHVWRDWKNQEIPAKLRSRPRLLVKCTPHLNAEALDSARDSRKAAFAPLLSINFYTSSPSWLCLARVSAVVTIRVYLIMVGVSRIFPSVHLATDPQQSSGSIYKAPAHPEKYCCVASSRITLSTTQRQRTGYGIPGGVAVGERCGRHCKPRRFCVPSSG